MKDLTAPAGRRRFIIDMARRRVRPGSGSSIEFLRSRTWLDPPVALTLRTLSVPYLIVGGLATALYMTRRMTPDTDILIRYRDSETVAKHVLAAGWIQGQSLAYGGQSWCMPNDDTVKVLTSQESWAGGAFESPNRSPTGLPVIALPYLVLMKLDASRTVDIGDVGRMLGPADEEARDWVRQVIRRFRPDQVDDVESLIALGDLEYQDG